MTPRWTAFVCSAFFQLLASAQQDDDGCAIDLKAADVNAADGFLVQSEYQVFVTARYNDCYQQQDDSGNLTEAQYAAFLTLSCLSCLDRGTNFTSIPECCQPDQSSIAIEGNNDGDGTKLSSICLEAEAAAAIDCPPPTTDSPSLAPAITSTNDDTVVMVENCDANLLAADANMTDGFLNANEYREFLLNYGDCTDPSSSFLSLSCASCLSEPGADLDCCLPAVARFSVQAAAIGSQNRTMRQKVWLNRICMTAANFRSECAQEAAETTTANPSALPTSTLAVATSEPAVLPTSAPAAPPTTTAPMMTTATAEPIAGTTTSPTAAPTDAKLVIGTSAPTAVPTAGPTAMPTAVPIAAKLETSVPVAAPPVAPPITTLTPTVIPTVPPTNATEAPAAPVAELTDEAAPTSSARFIPRWSVGVSLFIAVVYYL